ATGGQMGWRVPRVEELTSLADPSNFSTSPLPVGNPFANVVGNKFWAIDHQPLGDPDTGETVFFAPPLAGGPAGAFVNASNDFNEHVGVLCVRSGGGSLVR